MTLWVAWFGHLRDCIFSIIVAFDHHSGASLVLNLPHYLHGIMEILFTHDHWSVHSRKHLAVLLCLACQHRTFSWPSLNLRWRNGHKCLLCICLPYKQLSPMARHPMGGNPLPLDESGSLELLCEFSPGRPLSPWEWFFENNQKNHCTWSVATCHLRCVPWPVIMIWASRRGSYLNIVTLEWGLTMTNRKVGGFNLSSVALHKTPTFTFKFYLNL